MNVFKVINPGMFTTIQDFGRKGYQKYGIAVSGSVDHYAHRIANILVSNPQSAAVLEVTLVGLKLKALRSTVISITGGDLRPVINHQSVPLWKSLQVNKGDVIHFKGCKTGCRAYLAIAGGIDVPLFLGSKSTDTVGKFGGMKGRSLQKGDIIKTGFLNGNINKLTGRSLPPFLIPKYSNHINVRVILGPQDNAFTKNAIDTFLSSTYTVSKDLDRMACRLQGPELKHQTSADIDSEGLFLGAIQVPPNGKPIVLLTGRRSIGGYPKIGGVISVDLPKLAQLKQGDTINFTQVSVSEAHSLLKEQERKFTILNTHVTGGYNFEKNN